METAAAGGVVEAEPERPTLIGVPIAAVCAMERAPVRAVGVAELGLNVTEIGQVAFAPIANVPAIVPAGQPVVTPKSPVGVRVKLSALDSWLVRVRVLAALVVPTVCVLKASTVGETVRGALPVPERLTTCGLVGALS